MIKRSKYNNTKVEYKGMTFDSKKELEQYKIAERLQELGEIEGLQRQVRFELIPAQYDDPINKKGLIERACTYTADILYCDPKMGVIVVIDVKSPITRKDKAYIIKRKLMLWQHNIKIVEK